MSKKWKGLVQVLIRIEDLTKLCYLVDKRQAGNFRLINFKISMSIFIFQTR